MIMGDKSISVVLSAMDEDFNTSVLEVWFKVLKGYKHGGELILITHNVEDRSIESFQKAHEEDGVRIVGIKSSQPYTFMNVLKEVQYYIDAEYVWYSQGYTYPNGDIITDIERGIDESTLLILKMVNINHPFDYSYMQPRVREPLEEMNPPAIDTESFIVQSRAFKETAALIKKSTNGRPIAQAWQWLVGIDWKFSEKATVFVVQD
jgi:hypothetical protein